jgi:hypothetical protein
MREISFESVDCPTFNPYDFFPDPQIHSLKFIQYVRISQYLCYCLKNLQFTYDSGLASLADFNFSIMNNFEKDVFMLELIQVVRDGNRPN